MKGIPVLQQLRQDVLFAAQQFRRRPGFHLLAILPLSVGIAVSTAGFAVVNAVLFTPLPFERPNDLHFVWPANERRNVARSFAPYDDVQDWRTGSPAIESLGAFQYTELTITTSDRSSRITGVRADGHLFDVLGVKPALGRSISAADTAPNAPAVVVLGHAFWRQKYGGLPEIVGRSLIIDTRSHEVIGVMPPAFQFPRHPDLPERVEVWTALARPDPRMARQGRLYGAVARVPRDRVSQAHGELEAVAARLRQQFPRTHDGWTVRLVSLHEQVVGSARATLLLLFGTVVVVLLIAAANVGLLLMARSASRRQEFAVRLAIGASRGRLVRQLVSESAVLGVTAAAIGLALGYWTLAWLIVQLPAAVPRIDQLGADPRVLGFVAVAVAVCVLLFGLLPAVQASRQTVSFRDSDTRGATAGRSLRRWHNGFVVVQVAMATLLMAGAVTFTRTLLRLERTPTGFSPAGAVAFEVTLPAATYRDPSRVQDFYQRLTERFSALPDVKAVGGVNLLPPSTVNLSFPFTVDAETPASGAAEKRANFRVATPGYFAAMGIPLVSGRPFAQAAPGDGAPGIIINQALAARFFPAQDPVGRTITVLYGMGKPIPREIIGVVGDVRQSGPAAVPSPELYLPYSQEPFRWMTLVVRTTGSPASLVPAIRTVVSSLDPQVAVDDIEELPDRVAAAIEEPRFRTRLIAGFALLALVLAFCGAYGVMSYAVSIRIPELAIRYALGATHTSILGMLLVDGLRVGALGATLGIVAAFSLERVVHQHLSGLARLDGFTLALVVLVALGGTLIASSVPALRATRTDPQEALITQAG